MLTVHWEADLSAKEVLQDLEDPELPLDIRAKTVEEGVLEMVDAQQRNLDQWCFAEHFKPDILLQVRSIDAWQRASIRLLTII